MSERERTALKKREQKSEDKIHLRLGGPPRRRVGPRRGLPAGLHRRGLPRPRPSRVLDRAGGGGGVRGRVGGVGPGPRPRLGRGGLGGVPRGARLPGLLPRARRQRLGAPPRGALGLRPGLRGGGGVRGRGGPGLCGRRGRRGPALGLRRRGEGRRDPGLDPLAQGVEPGRVGPAAASGGREKREGTRLRAAASAGEAEGGPALVAAAVAAAALPAAAPSPPPPARSPRPLRPPRRPRREESRALLQGRGGPGGGRGGRLGLRQPVDEDGVVGCQARRGAPGALLERRRGLRARRGLGGGCPGRALLLAGTVRLRRGCRCSGRERRCRSFRDRSAGAVVVAALGRSGRRRGGWRKRRKS